MLIAKYVKDLANVTGDAKLFALDEPLDGESFLTVSVIDRPKWNLVVTHMIPATERGASKGGVDGSLSMVMEIPPGEDGRPLSHDAALATLGYTADYSPWPEPEPTTLEIEATRDFSVADQHGNVLAVTQGQRVALPIVVSENLIAQGVAVAVEGGE